MVSKSNDKHGCLALGAATGEDVEEDTTAEVSGNCDLPLILSPEGFMREEHLIVSHEVSKRASFHEIEPLPSIPAVELTDSQL